MDPPAGFVRACNPAVAAPRAPAPRGRTFPGRPPPGPHREPRSAPTRSVPVRPKSPLKCRSTLPGTGRCWPTRISRSTCARWVSAARRALAGAPGRAAGGGIPAPSRAGRPPACLRRPSRRPEHPDRGRGVSRGTASANWRTGVISVHGGQCLMVGSRSGSFH